jgi:hypothetical protein
MISASAKLLSTVFLCPPAKEVLSNVVDGPSHQAAFFRGLTPSRSCGTPSTNTAPARTKGNR